MIYELFLDLPLLMISHNLFISIGRYVFHFIFNPFHPLSHNQDYMLFHCNVSHWPHFFNSHIIHTSLVYPYVIILL